MQKKTPDYDNVFKTMKMKHKRLFVSVINDAFNKNYPMNVKVEVLPSEGYLTESETVDGSKEIEEQISDFLIKIGSEVYLLECQSYDDELIDLKGFVNTIITHIANGNKNEERLVNIMGGTIIETESEKLVRQGRAQVIIELGQEDGLDDTVIIERLQKKVGWSLEKAKSYLAQYGKQLA